MKPSPTQWARGRGKMAFTPRMVGLLEVDDEEEVEDADDPMIADGARSRRRRPTRWRMMKSAAWHAAVTLSESFWNFCISE